MATYILMGLGVAAVALLAGFTGGLPSRPGRPLEDHGIMPEPEIDLLKTGADETLDVRLPRSFRPAGTTAAITFAMVVTIGALGVVAFRLAACGGDLPNPQGKGGSSLAGGTMLQLPALVPPVQARAGEPLHDDHIAPAAAAPAALLASSEASPHAGRELRALRKPAVGNRKVAILMKGSVAHSAGGTWLFSPNANGGG